MLLITLLKFVALVIGIILFIWIVGVFLVNDFNVKSTKLKFKNILFVYAHPDDEVMSVGGISKLLSNTSANTTLLCLTKGEDYTGVPSEKIKLIRSEELKKSVKVLGIKNLIHTDLGDGKLIENRNEAENSIRSTIAKLQPDLVITFDLSGFYGHPDHMTVVELTTKVCKDQNIKLWYSSMPKKVVDKLNLPVHMAIDKEFYKKRVYPTAKVFIGIRGAVAMIKAMSAHKSQLQNYDPTNPLRINPLLLGMTLMVYEYFHEVNV
jgi:LmbE family N-acetylglucosaminyl deacetylase